MQQQRALWGAQQTAQGAQATLYGQQARESQTRTALYATQNRLAAMGETRAALDAEIAGSAAGRTAAFLQQFAPIAGAVAQGVGAVGLWRMRGAGGPAKSTARTTPSMKGSTSKAPHLRKSTGPRQEFDTWTNPKTPAMKRAKTKGVNR